MKHRRKAREFAVQALYYMDMRRNASLEAINLFEFCFTPDQEELDFFRVLVQGVLKHQSSLDTFLERFSEHWKVGRMACVDRNIMRIATYEMLFQDDIPPKVSINEAIELGKFFGTDESGAFINGILDGIHNAWGRKEIFPQPELAVTIPENIHTETIIREPVDAIPSAYSRVRGRPGLIRRRGGGRKTASVPGDAEAEADSSGAPDPASSPPDSPETAS